MPKFSNLKAGWLIPCDTIQTVGVKLAIADLDTLERALRTMGGYVARSGEVIYFGRGESFNKVTGELRVTSQDRAALIKRAYSAEIVKAQAKRFGWHLKETAPYQFEVVKR